MAFQMRADEMLDALKTVNHPMAEKFEELLNATANTFAKAICDHFNVTCNLANFDLAMTAAPFYPSYDGQPLPNGWQHYDSADQFIYDED